MPGIAIHGFGRIGRSALKAALANGLFVPVSISDVRDLPTFAALFAVDTNYGRWPQPVAAEGDNLRIGEHAIRYIDSSRELPDWAALGVEVVVDCTGRATTRAGAQAHLDRGAKTVLVSAPSKTLEDCDAVLLRGINTEAYDPARHRIISMASCTTNALAPVVQVLAEHFEITAGFFSTVHAYTNTQSLTDQPMKDRRDSWAAAENIILRFRRRQGAQVYLARPAGDRQGVPGAGANRQHRRAQCIGRARDLARRGARSVPQGGRPRASPGCHGGARGGVGLLPHRRRLLSSLVDLPLVDVLDGRMVSVAAWYDNEMGYSTRLAETARALATHAGS